MHSGDPLLWGLFILIGLSTLLPRSSFIVAGQARLPASLQRALRYAPAAALAALIAPDVLTVQGTVQWANPKVAATAVVIIAVLFSRNPWLPFVAGMGILAASQFF